MRLGEIKQKIDLVINENKVIVVNAEPQYGGQAQLVHNYSEILDVLEYMSTLEWSEVNKNEITEDLLAKYPKGNKEELLPQEEFNKLNSYVSRVNQKLPIYYSILQTMLTVQDEQIINIKLPENIKSLKDLDRFNQELEILFKKFNLAGEFQFKGFDKGSSWYEILITATALYKYFLACLAVAYSIVQLKKEYYKSELARLNYLTSIKDGEEHTESGQKDHSDRYIEVSLEEKIKNVVEEIKERNGKEKPELVSNLVMATRDLVKLLGEGVEFHLSFNPPQYATEKSGALNIDYSKMPKSIVEEKKENPKAVGSPKKQETSDTGVNQTPEQK